ncbi:hypothetical protein [Endozoicomonas sp. SCSIO W0465]|uniref:hypothetical protein n=1 Tax=Endozoicomonas sp. SCSIO W0465 TaxID=2918516 RepID=UPI0020753E63|nr:hypothetical protein [Endozoicomonas sp. SCSIO W0465]USE38701.1 hypothetical protein MJO57_11315 [Endozoicomonas sp. SCSIO W0465]
MLTQGVISLIVTAHSPIVAREVITIDFGGNNSAELEASPLCVILRLVSVRYFLPSSAVISVGVHHSKSLPQYSEMFVLGVPPLLISALRVDIKLKKGSFPAAEPTLNSHNKASKPLSMAEQDEYCK